MKKSILALMIIFAVMTVLTVGLVPSHQEPLAVLINKPVKKFVLPRLRQEGVLFSSEELKGQVTLINVWASWCLTCRIEHPLLMKVAKTENLNLYGLNHKDIREDALKWLDFYGNPYALTMVDENGVVGIDIGAVGVPATFVVDGDGQIRQQHIGVLTQEDWDEKFLPVLSQLEAEL